jgi:hypothetical protein
MIMHKNTSIIMTSTIAAILTTSLLAFALPNHAFAQPVIFSPQPAGSGAAEIKVGTPLAALRLSPGAQGAAPSVAANLPGLEISAAGGAAPSAAIIKFMQHKDNPTLALSAAGGAAPSVAANAPGLALKATGGAAPSFRINAPGLPGGFGCWPCPECGPCPAVGGGSGPPR